MVNNYWNYSFDWYSPSFVATGKWGGDLRMGLCSLVPRPPLFVAFLHGVKKSCGVEPGNEARGYMYMYMYVWYTISYCN